MLRFKSKHMLEKPIIPIPNSNLAEFGNDKFWNNLTCIYHFMYMWQVRAYLVTVDILNLFGVGCCRIVAPRNLGPMEDS